MIEVKIGSKIIIKDNSHNGFFRSEIMPLIEWCEENLVVTNPMWAQLMKLGKEDTIRYKHVPEKLYLYANRGNSIVLPFGSLYGIWNYIKDWNISLNFNVSKPLSIQNSPLPIELYDYQKKAVEAMVSAKGGVLVAPCGAGKTIMGIEIIHRINKKFLWLTHTKDLLNQALEDMHQLFPSLDVGLITEGKVNIGRDGAIATVQTLVGIDPDLYADQFEIVVCDETHHVCGSPTISKMFSKIIEKVPARYKYGLTATPERSDTMIKSMYTLIGMSRNGEFEPTYQIDRKEIKTIESEHLKFDINLNYGYDILSSDGTLDYNTLIDYLSDHEERNEIILDNIELMHKENRKQIVLCHRVRHCEYIYNKLLERGLNAKMVVGKVTNKKRKEILENSDNWDIMVATYSLLKEGVSIKALDTLHFTTPQKNKSLIVQCAGRIERYMENKNQPLVFDYVDNSVPYCVGAYRVRKRNLKNRF